MLRNYCRLVYKYVRHWRSGLEIRLEGTRTMSQQPPYGQQPNQQAPQYKPPSFYNQPTQGVPGQFSSPPYNNFPPPRKRTGLWGWYKTRTRRMKIGLGCGTLIAVILFFSCIGSAIGSSNLASTPTPTPTSGQAAFIISPTATQIPTPVPTHKPTPTPTPKPTLVPTHAPVPTQPPKPTSPPCQAVNGNPWCYNFVPGKLIYYPPSGFCNYFACIPTFYGSDDPGDGYIVECNDGSYSQSGGESGACSHHGGVMRPLYSH